jgi:hypothetical protein
LKVTEITFLSTCRVRLVVEIPDPQSYTTEGEARIPRILFKLFPRLAIQRCCNDAGHSFRREALATEIPHVFEHVILEIQDQVRRGSGAPFAGETQWNWTLDPRGRFYVTVDYDNEIVALGAIRLAERVINALDSKDIACVDMPREIARLRDLARLSRRHHHRPRPSGGDFRPSPFPEYKEPAGFPEEKPAGLRERQPNTAAA